MPSHPRSFQGVGDARLRVEVRPSPFGSFPIQPIQKLLSRGMLVCVGFELFQQGIVPIIAQFGFIGLASPCLSRFSFRRASGLRFELFGEGISSKNEQVNVAFKKAQQCSIKAIRLFDGCGIVLSNHLLRIPQRFFDP